MERSAGGEGFVIEHDRQVGGGALKHVFARDHNDHTGRTGVLLRAGVEEGVLAHVHGVADEIG